MAHRLPTSILPPRALAPILTVTFGVAALLEIAASLDRSAAYAWAGMLTVPILATTVASAFAARRQALRCLAIVGVALTVQTLGAALLFAGDWLWQVGVAISAMAALAGFVVMMPIFVLAGWLGRRDDSDADLEAGDLLLGSSAALFTSVNLLVAAFVEGSAAKASLLGGVFGFVIFAAAVISGLRRRRWLASIRRGAVPGLHIRNITSGDEYALPILFGRRERAHDVVVETLDSPVTAYRGGVPDVPLLTVPA